MANEQAKEVWTAVRRALVLIGRALSAGCAIQYLWWLGQMAGSWMGWVDWPQPGKEWVVLAFGYAFMSFVENVFPSLLKARLS